MDVSTRVNRCYHRLRSGTLPKKRKGHNEKSQELGKGPGKGFDGRTFENWSETKYPLKPDSFFNVKFFPITMVRWCLSHNVSSLSLDLKSVFVQERPGQKEETCDNQRFI